MSTIQNYTCPSCGGPLAYDAALAKLKCSYCDSVFDPTEAEKPDGSSQEQNESWNTEELSDDWGEDASSLKEYNCPSCGAQILCEQNTAATSCPYCDNPAIVETQFAGTLKPDYIIPFKIKKEKAVAALKEFYKGKPLLPKTFSDENHLEEAKGVYVPFWFFDGTAEGYAVFDATRSQTFQDGNETIRITKHYNCTREGELDFKLIPVDASKQMDDDLMDSIEPFNYKDLTEFSTGYLPGYLAHIHDVSVDECFPRARVRCNSTFIAALSSTVLGYDTSSLESSRINIKNGVVHYGLLPVYILNTKFEDKKYTFAVNGQTGKVVGNLPSSAGKGFAKFCKTFFITLLAEGLLALGMNYFLDADLFVEEPEMTLLCGCVIAGFAALGNLLYAHGLMKTVRTASEAGRYVDSNTRLSRNTDFFSHETRTVIARSEPRNSGQPGGSGHGGFGHNGFGGYNNTGGW